MRIELWCDARLRDALGSRSVAVERTTVAGSRRAVTTDDEPAALPFGGSPSCGSDGGTE
jgi:hypothetical protein